MPRTHHAGADMYKYSTSLIVALACIAAGPRASLAAELLIENVTVISPEQAAPQPSRHVLIRDGRIVAVNPQRIAPGKDAQRIDGSGKFLTPGLMDSHVHVGVAAGLPFEETPENATLHEVYFRQQPRSYLYFGVTQLVDLTGMPERIAVFEAQPLRPDLFRCAPAVVLDGYPTVFAPPETRRQLLPNYIFEPANAAQHPMPAGDDPAQHTPEFVVEGIRKSGARCVKIHIEDGFGPRTDWPIMSKETLARIRSATRKHGLLLVAHANAIDMQRIAVAGEVDVIAHGLWNWNELAAPEGVPEPIAAHLREIHAKRIGFQPTLRVLPSTADLFRADTLKDPTYAKVTPAAVLAWYATDAGGWFKREVQREFAAAPDSKMAQGFLQAAAYGARAVKYLHGLGHPLLLASDTPSSPTYGNQPGYDSYREMRLMAQSGVPLDAIFRAATLNNARQFRMEKDYGTVEAGKIANLLLLEGNPLETMRAWTLIDQVILRGKVIERETLAADAPGVR
jgi:imidazolonepropionase-like amidohydrolase